MKAIPSIIFAILLSVKTFSQSRMDSATVARQLIRVERVIQEQKLEKLVSKRQTENVGGNLLNENLALAYAKEILKKQYPNVNFEKKFYKEAVVEDSSKRFWIVMLAFPGTMDGFPTFVFVKQNGQLILLRNHWRG